MTETAIMAEGLVRRFGENEAVAGIDLRVESGEIYGFLGPNGAGKSTTVRMLVTLITPSAGRAEVAGFDVVTQPGQVRLHIGVALQDAGLDPKQTGRELLDLQGRLYGIAAPVRRARLVELAELVDIGDALDQRIATYSGGMKRRLDLAASLIHQPSVLFLDEPTTGLDPLSRQMVWEEVRRLNQQGVTIFLTTQYLEEADELADRVGIIAAGKVVAEGTPEALKRAVGADVILVQVSGDANAVLGALRDVPGVERVELRGDEIVVSVTDGPTSISPVAVALNGCGVKVDNLSLRTPTLDDVFLEITGGHLQEDDR
ncbi:MAG TPA: ATP-binding cassette domain-containing protein [Acidimicrobiales bacterium]